MAMTEKERQERAEKDATDFGHNPEKFRAKFVETRRRNVYEGRGKDREFVGTEEYQTVSKKNKARIEAAELNFENRAGSTATAEAQSRGGAGGSFSSQGDFGPGAIRLNTVTPVNSKVRGR